MPLMIASAAGAASKYEVLYAFKGGNDGNFPSGALVFDVAGNLYGATLNGGGAAACSGPPTGCGTVFALRPGSNGKWKESVIYRFQNGNDGAQPNGSLIFDASGNLDGTSGSGDVIYYPNQCGTAFSLAPSPHGWSLGVISTFCSDTNDGIAPNPGLVQDKAGNLYGMAQSGGSQLGGTAFQLTPGSRGWTESDLFGFCVVGSCVSSGSQPLAGLVSDAAGNLYGTTVQGGSTGRPCSGSFPGGCGVVFKLTPGSDGKWTESVLHQFTGPDGLGPAANLVFHNQGTLYGTTGGGGAFGQGTLFKLTFSNHRWKFSVLYNFRGSLSQGSLNSGVVFDAAGNLYGAILSGGIGSCLNGAGCGVVYKLTPESNGRWKYTALHSFSGLQDGGEPSGGLILDTDGNIFGTAGVGGVRGNGVVFEITP
jgi:uncharacterized repeat protein (TIGR03803 family)